MANRRPDGLSLPKACAWKTGIGAAGLCMSLRMLVGSGGRAKCPAGQDSVWHQPCVSTLTGLEVTPGPGSYSPEKVPPLRQRNPPAFTLGSRLYQKPLDTPVPAPNAYTMPPLWGSQIFTKPRSPSYTVVGRTRPARPPQDPADTPGPGQYDSPNPNTYRQRWPAFTMLGRPRALRLLEEAPGPGTHSPEQVTVNKARAPVYTIGIRHSKRAVTMAADFTP
ncbi:outer dense fiber protein 3-like protein 2 [Marmota marmota marmota]|uniref:outer dense fiber protein 3-like protein 2 n=1 Tax=Marmota marmota marmota TaxID=9994 RepID=UPI0020935C3D|nr:outer dense fiber protein 3-like protein 2 [Marmota marmota marmota]